MDENVFLSSFEQLISDRLLNSRTFSTLLELCQFSDLAYELKHPEVMFFSTKVLESASHHDKFSLIIISQGFSDCKTSSLLLSRSFQRKNSTGIVDRITGHKTNKLYRNEYSSYNSGRFLLKRGYSCIESEAWNVNGSSSNKHAYISYDD